MKKITGLLLGSFLLVGGMGIAVAQETTPPPKVLAIITASSSNRARAARCMRKRRALSCKP